MSTTPLFGQYYNHSKSSKYQTVGYECAWRTSGDENQLVFQDGNLDLIDTNGDTINSLDLSKAGLEGISEWGSQVLTVNAMESLLIPGIEYGKSYKEIWLRIPEVVTQYPDWEDWVNLGFNIAYNIELRLKSYNIRTRHTGEAEDICDRLRTIFDSLGLEAIEVSIEADDTGTWIKLMSTVLGYDFIIDSPRLYPVWQNDDYPGSPFEDSYGFDDSVYVKKSVLGAQQGDVRAAEENIVLRVSPGRATAYLNAGLYGRIDDETDLPHSIYGMISEEDGSSDGGSDDEEEWTDRSPYADEIDGFLNSYKDPDTISEEALTYMTEHDDMYVYYYELEESLDRHVPAFKYPNGAARCWVIVPEWPVYEDVTELSLRLNHVRDEISLFTPASDGHWIKNDVSVYAGERSEFERYETKKCECMFRRITAGPEGDETPAEVREIAIVRPMRYETVCGTAADLEKEEDILHIMNPHIGMYRYLQWVEETGGWTKFARFYGVMTADDPADMDVRNFANSVFVYNPNKFPVRIHVFIAR